MFILSKFFICHIFNFRRCKNMILRGWFYLNNRFCHWNTIKWINILLNITFYRLTIKSLLNILSGLRFRRIIECRKNSHLSRVEILYSIVYTDSGGWHRRRILVSVSWGHLCFFSIFYKVVFLLITIFCYLVFIFFIF